jgi:hypothetical protein
MGSPLRENDTSARVPLTIDCDTLVVRGVVESEDEYMRLRRIAHRLLVS